MEKEMTERLYVYTCICICVLSPRRRVLSASQDVGVCCKSADLAVARAGSRQLRARGPSARLQQCRLPSARLRVRVPGDER